MRSGPTTRVEAAVRRSPDGWGLAEGIGQGRADGRITLVCRLARLKLGADTANRLSQLLKGVSDREQIAGIGDRIIQCDTGTELLARAREV